MLCESLPLKYVNMNACFYVIEKNVPYMRKVPFFDSMGNICVAYTRGADFLVPPSNILKEN
jgi:hypothetical protein